jgi:hypothetical protein
MEADRAGLVYRVSHVYDGEFQNSLPRYHIDHYDFATWSRLLRALTSIPSAKKIKQQIQRFQFTA